MNAPTRKHRRHPLAALVLWLGSRLAACLLALAFAVTAAPAEAQLDSAYDAGVALGYTLCSAAQEGTQ